MSKTISYRNLTMVAASREIGFSDSYFATVMKRGVISKAAAKLLDNAYNIRLADYKLEEVPLEPVAPPAPIQLELDYVRLRNIIYEAVYSAVKKALSE